ncbi:MAG: hypothetical protein FXF49_11260 [Flexistipes sinusarabici]|uniref:Uncharacterized protein n=1 Tax=Flexistipes sinusarabici TaxID=2352 RepID=A0A5D0MML3_FLESI|nr:hypothetical protein [Flexistipes sinusarabici]TYB32488.1 MAG: hypothetical protein FXF49_11260 [Flexistipes sinusarabici]
MKYFKQLILGIATILLLFMLSACGSSSSDSTESATDSSLSGVVVDGYLDGAKVFLDCNNNLEQDYNEVTEGWTDENGNYSLSLPDNASQCAVVALGIANQTYEHFDNGTSEMLRNNLTMVSLDNDTYRVISPFTSLHWYYMNNDNMTFEEARNQVKQELGLPSGNAVFEDFVARARDNSSYRNMVQTSLKMGEYMGYYCSQDNSTDNMTVKMRNAFRYMHQNVGMDNFTDNNIRPGRMDELFPVNIGNMQQ